MSNYNPGPAGPMYVPPPSGARRGRSPWVWVGVGCGLLILLLFGGCTVMSIMVSREMKKINQNPRDAASVRKAIEQYVPVYPNADVNVPLSHKLYVATGAVGIFLPKNKPEMAAFRAPASPDTILAWYEKKLVGWKASEVPAQRLDDTGVNLTVSRQFVRNGTHVQIQAGPIAEEKNRSNLVIIVISGLPE